MADIELTDLNGWGALAKLREKSDASGLEFATDDADLTTIATLSPSNDDFIQRKAGAWTNRTPAQVKTDLGLSGTNSGDETASTLGATINGATAATPNDTDLVATVESSVVKKITWTNVKAFLKTYFDTLYQPLNSILTAFAALSPSNDDFLQRKAGAWANRTIAQVKSDLSLSGTNTGDQDLSGYATKTGAETLTNKTLTSPVVNSPTGIVKADVGLGNADNTSDANKPVSTAQQTALDGKAPTNLVGSPVEIQIALSDLTTALTTGTNKAYFRAPFAFTLQSVRASVLTAPTGSTLIVDINESGSTILSTKLSIDASEKTSTTAASAAVISDSAIADDAELTFDIDQVGSSVAGAGLIVTLKGVRV